SLLYPTLVAIGATTVVALQLAAGWRERRRDRRRPQPEPVDENDRWIDVGAVGEIPNNRSRVVCLDGCERVPVFRAGTRVWAGAKVCAQQRGPLGEVKIVDG